jgi:hypothetical protein
MKLSISRPTPFDILLGMCLGIIYGPELFLSLPFSNDGLELLRYLPVKRADGCSGYGVSDYSNRTSSISKFFCN